MGFTFTPACSTSTGDYRELPRPGQVRHLNEPKVPYLGVILTPSSGLRVIISIGEL